jgi:aryl-alcohol dehydrogenase-like predicted oxidoreductase
MIFGMDQGWGSDKDECRRIYDAFRGEGGNFIDTANTYGDSEKLLGELISRERESVVLATKYTGQTRRGDVNSSGSHRKSMRQSLDASLKDLQTDYIDLYWVHTWDSMTPVDELMRSFDDLVRQGKVLYIGISNAPAWFIAQANTLADVRGWAPFIAMQIEYNLIERTAERELLPMARALDIGVTAWAPLAAGWLTGKYGEENRSEKYRLDHRFAAAFLDRGERNSRIAREVVRVAAEIDRPPSQVALSWVRQRDAIPVIGARTVVQMKENLACLDFTLSREHVERLNEISKIETGYPHNLLAKVRRFTFGDKWEEIINHRGIK